MNEIALIGGVVATAMSLLAAVGTLLMMRGRSHGSRNAPVSVRSAKASAGGSAVSGIDHDGNSVRITVEYGGVIQSSQSSVSGAPEKTREIITQISRGDISHE